MIDFNLTEEVLDVQTQLLMPDFVPPGVSSQRVANV